LKLPQLQGGFNMNLENPKNSRQAAFLMQFLDYRQNVKQDFNKLIRYYPSCELIVKTKKYAELSNDRRNALYITIEEIAESLKLLR